MYKTFIWFEEIIEFIKQYFGLCFGFLASVVIMAKHSRLPGPSFLLDILKCPEAESVTYELFNLLNDLSLAFVSGVIVFIIIQYVPERKRAYKAFEMTKSDLCNLYSYMSRLIVMFLFENGIGKSEKEVKLADLSNACCVDLTDKMVDCKMTHTRNGIRENVTTYGYKLYSDSKNYVELIIKSLNKLKGSILCGDMDPKIVELLSIIENNQFVRTIDYINQPDAIMPGYKNVILGLDEGLYEFIKCHLMFNKYNFEKISYECVWISHEEMQKQRENSLFFITRAVFKHKDMEFAKRTTKEIVSLSATPDRLKKSVYVAYEMLICYDSGNEKPSWMLDCALDIMEHVKTHSYDENHFKYAFVNCMQIKKRMGSLTSTEFEELKKIYMNTELVDLLRISAAVICEDFDKAYVEFQKFSDEKKRLFINFPIYNLWIDPPIKDATKNVIFTVDFQKDEDKF